MTDIPTVKRCTKCGESKSVDGFCRDRSKRDGLASQCKECHRAYYEAYREERNAKARAYNEAHREQIAAQKRAYYEAHREERRAYREDHREELRAYGRDYKALLGDPAMERWQEITTKHATRRGRWSEAEDAYLTASTDRVVDDALELKRTYSSVDHRIDRLRARGVTLARDAHRR